jgi:2-oxoisovalerate dehydrogenase E2 component (dihydrolipoyl transacylase)
MGIYAFKLPDIGEGVVEGEVVEWMVAVGDTVTEDQPILSVMTDKATVEIPSPVNGVVVKRVGDVGDILPVGAMCIEFEVEGKGNASATEAAAPASEPEAASAPAAAPAPAPVAAAPPAPVTPRVPGLRPLASPAVRMSAREAGVDLTSVAGSGPAGRITRADLEAHVAGGGAVASAGPARTRLTGTTEIKVTGLRRRIADGMTASYSTIPHFSYFEEVDVTELEALRQHLNANREDGQPKLTYLPFIMLGLAKALGEHPICNAHYEDDRLTVVRHEAVNLGIATQTERGLYVPVVQHVEALDIWEAARQMSEVVTATRDGKATSAQLSGSTFTITSLGAMGGLGATPIINKPEVGILGVHKAIDRAVVKNGQVVVRRMMNFSSSFDHRVVDGWDGAMLVQRLKTLLEHPATIFM